MQLLQNILRRDSCSNRSAHVFPQVKVPWQRQCLTVPGWVMHEMWGISDCGHWYRWEELLINHYIIPSLFPCQFQVKPTCSCKTIFLHQDNHPWCTHLLDFERVKASTDTALMSQWWKWKIQGSWFTTDMRPSMSPPQGSSTAKGNSRRNLERYAGTVGKRNTLRISASSRCW